jgi:hypothetical protein
VSSSNRTPVQGPFDDGVTPNLEVILVLVELLRAAYTANAHHDAGLLATENRPAVGVIHELDH